MATTEMWTFVVEAPLNLDLSGFKVEALDGSIGKVGRSDEDAGGSFIVVDTGPWIFGKKVMLPAGVITDIDLDAETIFVNRTKDQIKNAPEFDDKTYRDQHYRDELGGYYGDRAGMRTGSASSSCACSVKPRLGGASRFPDYDRAMAAAARSSL